MRKDKKYRRVGWREAGLGTGCRDSNRLCSGRERAGHIGNVTTAVGMLMVKEAIKTSSLSCVFISAFCSIRVHKVQKQ